MARTKAGAQLTEAHRRLQAQISAGMLRDLLGLWAVVDPTNLKGTLPPFVQAGRTVVLNGRKASAAAASRYYIAFRRVEGVGGTVVVGPPKPMPHEVVNSALIGAGVAGIRNARRRGASVQAAHDNGFVKMSGSAAQLVAGGGRALLLDAIQSDPEAVGFQRVTDGSPCAFCAMIASQGIIAKSADSAGFEAHGHCGCTAEPAFEGSALSPTNARFRAAWHEATGGLSGADALNAFRQHLSAPQ